MFNYVCSITYRMTERVCVIGAGPSGMCFMYHLDQMKRQGLEVPDVVCYEKQADWGGVWNYDWRTGNQCDHNGQFFLQPTYRFLAQIVNSLGLFLI